MGLALFTAESSEPSTGPGWSPRSKCRYVRATALAVVFALHPRYGNICISCPRRGFLKVSLMFGCTSSEEERENYTDARVCTHTHEGRAHHVSSLHMGSGVRLPDSRSGSTTYCYVALIKSLQCSVSQSPVCKTKI